MRDSAYIKRLTGDIDRWRSSGTLSEDQARALLEDAQARAKARSANPSAIAAALGALLLGMGLITFVAANWSALPKIVRLVGILALIWSIFGAAIAAFERRATWIGHALTLGGALAIGAAIALIGQTYNIAGDANGLLLLWAIATLATALAFNSPPTLVAYVTLALVWFVFDRPGTALLFSSARVWSVRDLGLFYPPLWFVGAGLAQRTDEGASMHLSGLGMLVWMIFLFCDGLWGGADTHWFISGLLLCGVSAIIGAVSERMRARRSDRASAIALSWSAAGVFVGLLIAEADLWNKHATLAAMAFAGSAIAVSAGAIAWGDAPGRRAVRAFALALFGFECFYIYVALFRGLLDTAFFLLGAGALLCALAYGLRAITHRPATAEPS